MQGFANKIVEICKAADRHHLADSSDVTRKRCLRVTRETSINRSVRGD